MYEVMKAHVATMEITTKSEDVHLEVYKRGDWCQEYLVNVGGKSVLDFNGKKIEVCRWMAML